MAADSSGVISFFVFNVMVSCYWGENHSPDDTSVVKIAKTMKQLTPWMHPDHVGKFIALSQDHHDLWHNGFLAMTAAVTDMQTLFSSYAGVGGITASTPF
ncbi:MAG: hypothetical protein ACKPKO_11300, partial [Candidatus Fonsibacter sp.]